MAVWTAYRDGREDAMNDTPFVLQPEQIGEFWTEERCHITELINDPKMPAFSLAIARVEPAVTTQLHALKGIKEIYILRQGKGVAEVNGKNIPLCRGSSLFIPEGAAQRITNTGDEDLEFYCHCTPRFVPESYINLENVTNTNPPSEPSDR